MDIETKEAILKLAGYELIEDDGWRHVWRDEQTGEVLSWSGYSQNRATNHAYHTYIARQNGVS